MGRNSGWARNVEPWTAMGALATILTLGTLTASVAQAAELFEPVPPTAAAAVSPDQQSNLDRIRSQPTTANVRVVRLNLDALRDSTTQLALPDALEVTATRSNVELRSEHDYTWFGSLTDVPGNAILVVRDGNVTGTVHNGTDLYRIEPIGNGLHAVVKVDQSRFPPEEPPSFQQIERRGDQAPRPEQRGDQPPLDVTKTIDVLVGYTPSARGAVPDIGALIQLAVDEANQSYRDSQINIQLRLVDSYEVSYTETGKSFDTILADWAGKTDGQMDEVHQRRDQRGADLAALIINQTDYCGMADAIMANEATAFAIVHYGCATGYYSFAHELGHLMGARHDPDHDTSTTPFAYGHGYQNPTGHWRTIMAYDCSGGCTRLQYWSDPRVQYSGQPMGTATTHDNTRVLNETAATVAAFRTPAGAWGGWETLGGVIMEQPDCTTWSANRIDCFVRGTDGAMWHRWWDGAHWGGWESLGGVIMEQPDCASWAPNRIDCFARGTDGAMWHRWWDGAHWGGWENLGGLILEAPKCVNWGESRIDCFARGIDRAMWHRWWDGAAWGGWESLGGTIQDRPECVSWLPNRLDCFTRGTDNALWHRWWDGAHWGGWESLGGVILEAPACVAWGPNRLDCFARGTDAAMWHRWWDGAHWGGWESLGGVIMDQPECASWGQNRIDCFARGTDRAMWHRWWDGAHWGGWESLGGVLTTRPVCASWSGGRLDCFARGTDNAMWHRWFG